MTSLAGRVALVMGASRGTGVDIARALASAGARIAVHYRADRAAAAALAVSLRDRGAGAEIFGVDVAPSDEVRRLVAEVQARLGPPAVVVNNAGPFNDTRFGELAEADWGHIVNIGATSGLVRSHGVAAPAHPARGPTTYPTTRRPRSPARPWAGW